MDPTDPTFNCYCAFAAYATTGAISTISVTINITKHLTVTLIGISTAK
jgi:hypothetical protein